MWGFLLGRVSLAPVGGSGLRLFTLVSFGAPAPNPANDLGGFSLGPAALLFSLGLRPCGCHSLACGHILILGPAALRFFLFGLRPCSYPWAYGPAVATLWPTAVFVKIASWTQMLKQRSAFLVQSRNLITFAMSKGLRSRSDLAPTSSRHKSNHFY